MTKIPAKLRLDNKLEGDSDIVQNMLDDAYLDIAPAVNRKVDIVVKDRDPTPLDKDHSLGTFWLNSSTGDKFQLTQPATWTSY